MTMTRGQVREETRRLVKDTDSTNYRWTDDELNNRINQSHERIACDTNCIESMVTDGLTANVAEYELPGYFFSEYTVLFKDADGEWQPLQKRSMKDLDITLGNWRSLTTTSPLYYYLRRNRVGLVPMPDFTRTNALRLHIYRRPDSMTTDADTPFESNVEMYPFHQVLAYDVAEKCMLDDGQFDKAAGFKQLVDDLINQIRDRILESDTDTRIVNLYETARIPPRRTR